MMQDKGHTMPGAKILMLGLSFKENCADLRNTRVMELVADLHASSAHVDTYDPWVSREEVKASYGLSMLEHMPTQKAIYDAIVIAVPHQQFIEAGIEKIRALMKTDGVLYDVKSVFPASEVDGRL
jgi:UDP-N-acetyl-D-glucosamine/UDP-N-acetyl-D-galactosamine dehydrogenase